MILSLGLIVKIVEKSVTKQCMVQDVKQESRKMLIPTGELIRSETSVKYGTISLFKLNKEVFSMALEPADRENAVGVSSIPTGQYICKRRNSPAHGETFTVQDVHGRTFINFHPMTFVEQTEGCIGLGSSLQKVKVADKEKRALLNSGETFAKFMKELEGYDEFHLTIKEEY